MLNLIHFEASGSSLETFADTLLGKLSRLGIIAIIAGLAFYIGYTVVKYLTGKGQISIWEAVGKVALALFAIGLIIMLVGWQSLIGFATQFANSGFGLFQNSVNDIMP